ncbi:hypothetical protein [Paraburkholderia sp. DHOC27]|uniref:hypothetical protein n=1 Tax=Paraburkholderia sp. DHOC27 TaxID=2303330 RepID=UPI000E3E12AB|nr:hypothetical protein [Paraburkholderia sp. DHOC27]RFU48021.1 hypothetical protein D0B32_10910 [Paraburkholderia sp. DHOC27]
MDKDYWPRLHKLSHLPVTVYVGQSTYVPPGIGEAYARLVGYFELGKHEEENMQQKMVLRDKVDLIFELSGPNHQPRKMDDGTLIPHRVTVQETLSFSDRANFFKLFTMMNQAHGGQFTHMAQLLGKAFRVEVFHRKSADGKKVYANLKGPNGYSVGSAGRHNVDPPITALRYFIWAWSYSDMWESIYIPGEYPATLDDKGGVISPARSRNVLQERIQAAVNWSEHPLSKLVR